MAGKMKKQGGVLNINRYIRREKLLITYNYQKMTPEEKARLKIDQWFADAGWKVINRDDYEPTCTAVAIRERLLKGNLEADYFLFINGKAIGVLEA